MFLVWEMISEAGPRRRKGLAERDRELRVVLVGFARDEPASILRVSGSGWRDSSMGLRLGDHLEVCCEVVSGVGLSRVLAVS